MYQYRSMSNRIAVVLVLFLLLLIQPPVIHTQTNDATLLFIPTVSIPLGPVVDEDLQLFTMGGGGTIRADFSPGFSKYFFGRASLGFDFLPLNGSESGFTVISGGGTLGAVYDPSPRFSLRIGGGFGMYLAYSDLGSVRNPYFEAGTDLYFRLGPAVGIGIGGVYRQLTTPSGPLYQGLSVSFGMGYNLAGSRKGTEIFIEPNIAPIFPLFFTYYDKNPAGEITISNKEGIPYEKMVVSFYAKQYMDSPRTCAELGTLKGGESKTIPVYALFNDSIFRVTEGTKAAGDIIVNYYYLGKEKSVSFPVTLQVQNRNAMTWDDDRKAAAFITAKDPQILGFAKNVASNVRSDGKPPISEDFRTAFALFQTLKIYGMGYTVDPKTPYTALSNNEQAIDFLQFPNQTLTYRAGDCDDLSVLYAALLESVGISAALITTPGHIFVAFDLGPASDGALRYFTTPGDFILRDEHAWCPVEVTLVREGFLRAWKIGMQEWEEAEAAGKEGFFPIRDAWKLYEPVGFIEGGISISLPSPEKIIEGYRSELMKFYDIDVAAKVAELRSIDKTGGKAEERTANRIGILYAQLGILDKALEQFRIAVRRPNYTPALTNLGNVLYLQGDNQGALDKYRQVLAILPNSTAALAGTARVLYSQAEYQKADQVVAQLKDIDPILADRLDLRSQNVPTARAAEAGTKEVGTWEE